MVRADETAVLPPNFGVLAIVPVFCIVVLIPTLVDMTIFFGPDYPICSIEQRADAVCQMLYTTLLNCFLPPTLMVVFDVLLIIYVRRVRTFFLRIQPSSSLCGMCCVGFISYCFDWI